MNITQRQATLVLLGVPCLSATVAFVFWLVQPAQAQGPELLAAALGALAFAGLFAAYWRGWEPARPIAVVITTLLVGLFLQEPYVTVYAPLVIAVPLILAFILAGPAWVGGSALALLAVLLVRAGGHGVYAEPITIATSAVVVSGLIVGRLVIETGQRATIAQARQAHAAEAALRVKSEEAVATTQQLWHAARLATLGELAASMAHELNNPLQTVTLHVEALLVDTPSDDASREHLQVVERETERMAQLVANLLQFSRRNTPQISTLDVRNEIEKTLELVQYQFRQRKINVVREFASELPTVQADHQQIRQLFLNLFTNASDAMPTRGTLTIRVNSQAKQIAVEIVDTGQGIAPDSLAQVLEPFFTTKPEGKGTGLGLAICRRIAQEHGGRLDITSAGLGKGATVILHLPAGDEPG